MSLPEKRASAGHTQHPDPVREALDETDRRMLTYALDVYEAQAESNGNLGLVKPWAERMRSLLPPDETEDEEQDRVEAEGQAREDRQCR